MAQLGLTSFGEVGDAFDPRVHEALMHTYSAEVDSAVCQAILQVGYQFGERVLRPARVAVAEPAVEASSPQVEGVDEVDGVDGVDGHVVDEPAVDDVTSEEK